MASGGEIGTQRRSSLICFVADRRHGDASFFKQPGLAVFRQKETRFALGRAACSDRSMTTGLGYRFSIFVVLWSRMYCWRCLLGESVGRTVSWPPMLKLSKRNICFFFYQVGLNQTWCVLRLATGLSITVMSGADAPDR